MLLSVLSISFMAIILYIIIFFWFKDYKETKPTKKPTTTYYPPAPKPKKIIAVSMREEIEKALPDTPIGCMWEVKKIKRRTCEIVVEDSSVDPFNFNGVRKTHKMKLMIEDHPMWHALSQNKTVSDRYFVEIRLLSGDRTFRAPEDILISSSDDFMKKLTEDIKSTCKYILEEYVKDQEDWDGIYIKNRDAT